jgi:hypothetical protein
MKTVARQIADKFENDGGLFVAEDGRQLVDVCEDECTAKGGQSTSYSTFVKYWFSDRSSIVISGGVAWDLGFETECFCWRSAGHHQDCEFQE